MPWALMVMGTKIALILSSSPDGVLRIPGQKGGRLSRIPLRFIRATCWQHNPASYQRTDKDGSHERITDRAIADKSLTRSIEAMDNSEAFTQSIRTIEADDTHLIGGSKTVKVNGAMNLLAGGRFDMGAGKDLHITSLTNQRFKAPKTWLGSQDESVLRQLSELMQLVIDLCNILSSHTHPSVGACSQGGQISTVGSDTSAVKARLDEIKE
jgi:hypothetical protein